MNSLDIVQDKELLEGMMTLFMATREIYGRRIPNEFDRMGKARTGPVYDWSDNADGERVRRPVRLTTEVMCAHANGNWCGAKQWMLLGYQVNEEGQAVSTAIDLDVSGADHADIPQHFKTEGDAQRAAIKIGEKAKELGLTPWHEQTKSGGSRLWIFHDPVAACEARDLGFLLLSRAKMNLKIEVFPKQASTNVTGSGIFAPYYGPNALRGRQVMKNLANGEIIPLKDFVPLALTSRTKSQVVTDLVTAARARGEIGTQTKPTKTRGTRKELEMVDTNSLDTPEAPQRWAYQLERCAALRGIVETAEAGETLGYDAWMRLATHLQPYGEWGRKEFHRLSELDDRYDADETDSLFDSLTAPTNCDKMECGRNPQADCGLPQGRHNCVFFGYIGGKTSRPNLNRATVEGEWHFEKCIPNPYGEYRIQQGGIYCEKTTRYGVDTIRILGRQLYLNAIKRDMDTNEESIELVWERKGQWEYLTVPRLVLSDARALVQLAAVGVPVHSGNAREMVNYIAHLLDYHQDTLPLAFTASTCGYKQIMGQQVFLWGGRVLHSGETAPSVTLAPDADAGGIAEAFRPFAASQQEREEGLERWVKTARRLGCHPIAAFGLAATFLTILMDELHLQQNPVLDFAGLTSSGKSTVLRFAASVWGYPTESMGGLIRSWNSTPVYLERLAAFTNYLPVFLDESHNARPEQVQNIIYQYANGTGRGRGTKDGGVQRTVRYKGVLFSAGEAKLADSSLHDGTQARVLGFWGSPFGPNQAELVREVNETAETCFGLAGPEVLLHWMEIAPEERCKVREAYDKAATRLRARATDSIGERLAALCAAVEIAGKIANRVLELGWEVESIVEAAFARLTENRKTSGAETSLALFGSWIAGRESLFAQGSERQSSAMGSPRELPGRYLTGKGGVQWVAVLPDVLKNVLTAHNYNYNSIVAQWNDMGWLQTDSDRKRNTKRVSFQGNNIHMVVLSQTGMEVARGNDANGPHASDVLRNMGYEVENSPDVVAPIEDVVDAVVVDAADSNW